MNVKQTMLWTALPNGLNSGVLKVSVLISLRLGRKGQAMQVDSPESLFDSLEASQLLSSKQLAALRQEAKTEHNPPAARSLIQRLVDKGTVTPWQGNELLAGRRQFFFGNYQLLDEIGSGGMGVVYKAMHLRLQRLVPRVDERGLIQLVNSNTATPPYLTG